MPSFRSLRVGLRKGHHHLIQAFRMLRTRHAKLTLVGPVTPGWDKRLNLEQPGVRATGPVSRNRVIEELQQASVFVLASIEEGLALVIAQAMACGLPVIATEATGVRELITDGVEGIVVPDASGCSDSRRSDGLFAVRQRSGPGDGRGRPAQSRVLRGVGPLWPPGGGGFSRWAVRSSMSRTRLGIVVTNPIQYQVPLFRHLADRSSVEPLVFFLSEHGLAESFDPGFGRAVKYDVPLLGGYEHRIVRNRSPKPAVGTSWGVFNPSLPALIRRSNVDVILVHGYSQHFPLVGLCHGAQLRDSVSSERRFPSGPTRHASPKADGEARTNPATR